jgi:hypothetical protein
MPNAIKYSTTGDTLSLKKGNIFFGVGDVGKGPSSTTAYYNGVTPPVGGYTIYSYNASQTSNLSFFTAINDASLITYTNGVSGQNFSTATQCLNWYATQSNYVCVNRDYEGIVTNGLLLNLDAGFTPSYTSSGTTWYDLSYGINNGTLTNGPTFNSSNGGSIVFDGVDDETSFTNGTFGYSPGTTGEISLEIWIYPTGPYTSYVAEPPTTNLGGFIGQGYFGGSTGWGIGMFRSNGNNYFAFQVRNQGTIVQTGENNNHIFTNNNWYHVVGSFTRNNFSRVYINGVLASSTDSTPLNNISLTPSAANAQISTINTFYAGCRLSVGRIYNRPLSQTEVLQNFNAQKSRFGL